MRAVDHYTEAEKLLDTVTSGDDDGLIVTLDAEGMRGGFTTHTLAAAQVHATLALAGATALQAYSTGNEDELTTWEDIAGGDEDS